MARNENHIETEKTIGSEIVAGLTELCETVERGESLDAKFTVRTVELNLEPTAYEAEDVREIRRSLNVSQAVFAQILGTSVETVEGWEQGTRNISSMGCRLLELISRNRDHWIRVLRESKRATASA